MSATKVNVGQDPSLNTATFACQARTIKTQLLIPLPGFSNFDPALNTKLQLETSEFSPRPSCKIGAVGICCIIPFYPNHDCLPQAIESILDQSLSAHEIILCVDGDFPLQLSLRQSSQIIVRHFQSGSGPFAMVDSAIRETNADVICLQDSDDVSHQHRFRLQMELMRAADLDAVGTNCVHFCETGDVSLGVFPINPTATLKYRYGHVVLYPSLLFSRSTYLRIGGFSTFRKFGMDTEFVNRLCLTARVQNVMEPLYFKRSRTNSLTRSVDTGFGGKARREIEMFSRDEYEKQLQ